MQADERRLRRNSLQYPPREPRSDNLGELARRVGMSHEGLYKALSAEGNPSFATIIKVAQGSGCGFISSPVA